MLLIAQSAVKRVVDVRPQPTLMEVEARHPRNGSMLSARVQQWLRRRVKLAAKPRSISEKRSLIAKASIATVCAATTAALLFHTTQGDE